MIDNQHKVINMLAIIRMERDWYLSILSEKENKDINVDLINKQLHCIAIIEKVLFQMLNEGTYEI